MAFKTKEELFGDDDTNGARVPISESNPAGHGSSNRGVAFGERLTAAVANRTAYALAVNDEDLDDRVADFESRGLDAAYDGGLSGEPGSGRGIGKNAGAVETASELAAPYADDPNNAHFRANATGDTAKISNGFEYRDASGIGAGFMDLRPLLGEGGYVDLEDKTHILTTPMACVLNPGGSAPPLASLSTEDFATSGYTSIARAEFYAISGTDDYDGVYYGVDFPADTAVTLYDWSGAPASFGADTAAFIQVLRPIFSTAAFTDGSTRGENGGLTNPTFMGLPGAPSALDLAPRLNSSASNGGSANALRVQSLWHDGVETVTARLDHRGRLINTLHPDNLDDAEQRTPLATAAAVKQYDGEWSSAGMGFVALGDEDGPESRYDFLSLKPYHSDSGVDALDIEFIAASPTDGEIEITTSLDSSWQARIQPYATFLYIQNEDVAFDGLYVVTGTLTAPTRLVVTRLSGDVPDNLPDTGTVSSVPLYAGQRMGPVAREIAVDAPLVTDGEILSAENLFANDGKLDSASLALMTAGALNNARSFIRCVNKDGTSGDLEEKFAVTGQGNVYAGSDFISPGGANQGFKYSTNRSRTIMLSPASGVNVDAGLGSSEWAVASTGIALYADNVDDLPATRRYPLQLPTGAVISQIGVLWEPGGDHSNRASNGVRLRFVLQKSVCDLTGPTYDAPTNSSVVTAYQGDTTDREFVTASPSETVANGSTTFYELWIISGSTELTDFIYGIQLVITFPEALTGV